MNIYELDAEFTKTMDELLSVFDEETGEVTDIDRFEELKKALDGLAEERKQKISNVACWYKSLVAEANAIKEEKQKLAKRQAACENKAENLKKYLEYALQGEKFKDARVNITYRPTKSVGFISDYDYSKLPPEFQKVTIEPKKTEIKKAIESGVEIPGAFIEEKVSTIIK
jgi:hypothetical protein